MKLSILHISDLHRDPANPIRNGVLIDSLERDRDRYTSNEATRIRHPDIIIVSGDIIQGAQGGTPDIESNLQSQYEEALDFLNNLTDRFLNGDKRLVIIVPGNHDVSDYHFRQSLAPLDIATGAKKELVEQLFNPDSLLRWSWTECALYKIENAETYMQRFGPFADFYSKFYEGQRSYSIDPAKQFDIFDFPDWGIAVTGFSSCYNNDLLNRQGMIHPDCIAEASKHLRNFSYQDRLRVAVWHHNIEGPPLKVDYMDPDIVQNLIDSGFSLGFHGHQHKPQFIDTRFRYGLERHITVISAGTLCGGPVFRYGRAYNLIELDTEERTGRLHVREMQNDNLQMPIWGPRPMSLDFTFDPPPKPLVNSDRNTTLLMEAEQLHCDGKYNEAVQILSPLIASDNLARPLLLDCLIRLDDTTGIIAAFDPPEGTAEAIALMDSLWRDNERQRLAEVLALPLIDESAEPSIIEMKEKYSVRLRK